MLLKKISFFFSSHIRNVVRQPDCKYGICKIQISWQRAPVHHLCVQQPPSWNSSSCQRITADELHLFLPTMHLKTLQTSLIAQLCGWKICILRPLHFCSDVRCVHIHLAMCKHGKKMSFECSKDQHWCGKRRMCLCSYLASSQWIIPGAKSDLGQSKREKSGGLRRGSGCLRF